MDVLNRIRELTKEKNLTIYKLSELSGIPQSTLFNMFSRRTMPSVATLTQLCEAFNITLSEFFNEENSTSNDELYLLSKYRELSAQNQTTIKELINIMLKNEKQ